VKLLITGARGQLGLALQRRLSAAHELVAVGHAELDISDAGACERVVSQVRPDAVLNCAAYTAVDKAETDREAAFAINAKGAGNIAAACAANGAFPIHFSTDYVFDGTATQPYVETNQTNPLGVYGQTKLQGEQAVAAASAMHLIFRLSWVYSNDGANFYKTMLRLAADRPVLRVVADQFGVPNYTGDLADAIAAVLSRSRGELERLSGLYHLTAHGTTNWCEFARAIMQGAALTTVVEAIGTADYPTPAKRPAYSVLDSAKFDAAFSFENADWRQGLARCLVSR
jgi:dTDP-4-dehydrorhamnose reductase